MTTYQDLGYNKIFVSLDGTEAQAKVLDRAIITSDTFTALLLMAVASTMLTVPRVSRQLAGQSALQGRIS